jgi:endonuclease/exonuclease/phosphatase (EEP) superfamily protein YafD
VTREGAVAVLRTAAWIAGWAVIAMLAAVAVDRLVAPDRGRLSTLLLANTFWLFLPAYVIAVGALVARRWRMAACALVLVGAHFAWVLPQFTRERAVPASADRAPRLRVVTANLRFDNDHRDALARELRRARADIVVLQEVTPRWWETLGGSGLMRAYDGRARVLRNDAGGAAILARRPLLDVRIDDVEGWPVLSALVRDDTRPPVRVFAVHPVPPAFHFARHERMTDEITRLLRERLRDDVATVVAGDLNATQYNQWLGTLRRLGLRSAHEDRGRPFATTWPNGQHPVPPVRLDHVLLTDQLVTVSVREGDGAGSDHRPVIADIAVLPANAPR